MKSSGFVELSGYPTPIFLSGLENNLYANVFGAMRVVGVNRNPFSLDIEVTTNRFFGIGTCKDVSILVYGEFGRYKGQLLGKTTITTSSWDGCKGQGRITFVPTFNPDDQDAWFRFQLLGGKNPDALANTDMWKGQYLSEPQYYGAKNTRELQNSGLLVEATKPSESNILTNNPLSQALTAGVAKTEKILNRTIVAAALIGGAYFLWPHRNTITKAIQAKTKK